MTTQTVSEIIAEIRIAKEKIESLGETANTIRVSDKMMVHPEWKRIRQYCESVGLKWKLQNRL